MKQAGKSGFPVPKKQNFQETLRRWGLPADDSPENPVKQSGAEGASAARVNLSGKRTE